MEYSMSRRSQGLRESLSRFHFAVMLLGCILLYIGAYTINSTLCKSLSLCLLTVGVLITLISFVAYFGTQAEHLGFLKTYCSVASGLLVLQIAVLSLAFIHRADLEQYGSRAWDFFHEHDAQLLVQLEQWFKCCGYDTPTDRPEPEVCPVMPEFEGHVIGCKAALISTAQPWRDAIIIGILLFLAIQVVTLLMSVILTVLIEREIDDERVCRALLSHQPSIYAWSNTSHSSLSSSGRSPVFVRQNGRPWPRPSGFGQASPPAYTQTFRTSRYGSIYSSASK